jgi:hypothetical protein
LIIAGTILGAPFGRQSVVGRDNHPIWSAWPRPPCPLCPAQAISTLPVCPWFCVGDQVIGTIAAVVQVRSSPTIRG